MYGVLLIGVLIITGGGIAFIGDRLGTKVGKKRLSIFGLRPRHTSMIVTIFTGICITTLTFGVMAAASENVRTALFGMEELNRNMQETSRNLEQAMSDLAVAQKEQEAANEALSKSKDEVSKLQKQQKELEEESKRLQEGNRLLEVAKENLTRRNDELSRHNEELVVKNEQLEQSNETLSSNNRVLSDTNRRLEQQTDALKKGLITIREGDIVFRANEIIASGVIQGGRSKEEVAQDFAALANLASRNISERLGINVSDSDIWIYQPEYEAAVEEIAKNPKDSIVRIMSAGNLVRGEPVRASLQVYPNSVIYAKDEFIIARTYEIQNGDDAESILLDFLQEVNAEAVGKGILSDPIRGSVGVMEGDQFYSLVEALMPLRGSVVFSAYARSKTDALGPLRLNVKMERAE